MPKLSRRLTPSPWHKRFITWPLSGAAAWLGVTLLGLPSIDWASGFAGRITRAIGPRLSASNRARRNLRDCFPDWDDARIEATVRDMWENFGRTAGEYPHLRTIDVSGDDPRVEVVGRENIVLLRDDGLPGIVFSAHLGNWELLPMLAAPNDLNIHSVYRAMNAPLAEKVLRQSVGRLEDEMIPKGREGAIRMARVLRKGGHLAIMIDQKLNEGIDVPFFGRPAKTAPALAMFALKYRCPVVPARVERLAGARFRVTLWPPIPLPDSGDAKADTLALMTEVNRWVEGWVRDTPGQWLWLHRRWGK